MAKRKTSISLSDATRKELIQLCEYRGESMSEVIAWAVAQKHSDCHVMQHRSASLLSFVRGGVPQPCRWCGVRVGADEYDALDGQEVGE